MTFTFRGFDKDSSDESENDLIMTSDSNEEALSEDG